MWQKGPLKKYFLNKVLSPYIKQHLAVALCVIKTQCPYSLSVIDVWLERNVNNP